MHGCLNGTADLGDGIHPNAAGYEKMGKYWAGLVDEYLKSSKPAETTTTTAADDSADDYQKTLQAYNDYVFNDLKEYTAEKYQYDKDLDPVGWFRDCYGIVRDPEVPIERVVIRAFGKEVFYLRDLPLHHSQKEITTTEEYSDFELTLRPTADFLSPLLSRGSAIMIIEPQRLADDIKRIYQAAIELYD